MDPRCDRVLRFFHYHDAPTKVWTQSRAPARGRFD